MSRLKKYGESLLEACACHWKVILESSGKLISTGKSVTEQQSERTIDHE